MTDEKNEVPRVKTTSEQLPINQATLDIIVANVIPSSKYFEARFDHLEHRVIRIESEMKDFRSDVDNRFKEAKQDIDNRFKEASQDIDKRFNEAKQENNKRFEQVDKRFEQVDKRFDEAKQDNNDRFKEMIQSINRLSDNLDKRDNVQRNFTLRMFSISIFISFVGVLGVALKLFGV